MRIESQPLQQKSWIVSEDVYSESLEGDITKPEVYTAVRALKNGKSAGPDGIIGEFFKHSATFVWPFLVKLFKRWGERDRQTDRDRENSNSKTLFYKDCVLGSVKNMSNN